MLPILLVLGATGAILEIKRLVARPPREGDLFRIQQSEEKLRRVLQDVQRELHQERSEHQMDQDKINELEAADAELRKVQAEALARKEEEINERTSEISRLAKQVDTMQIRHEEENRLKERKFEAELHKLKEEIAYTFEQYSDGKIGAKSLLEEIASMGVDVQLTAEELEDATRLAIRSAEGERSTKQLQLQVDSQWRSQLRLLSDDPERISRQLAEGAHKSALPAQGTSYGSFPTVKTPPKDRVEANIFANIPALSLSAFADAVGVNKENMSRSSHQSISKVETKEPLQTASSARNLQTNTLGVMNQKRVQSPAKPKRKTHVPRLGLAAALKTYSPTKSNRDTFALGDMSTDDDEHRMLNRSII